MDVMRVVFSHDIFSAQRYGGISRYFSELIAAILARDQFVEVYAGFYVNRYLDKLHGASGFHGRPVRGPLANKLALRVLNEVGQLLTIHFDRGTVLHRTYYPPVETARHAAVVTTVHDLVHERFGGGPLARLNSVFKRRSCARADVVIAPSQSTKRDLVDLWAVASEKIAVIYEGSRPVTSTGGTELDRSPSPTGKPFLLFAGMRGGYKNFACLIDALARLPRVTAAFDLICFGGGPLSIQEAGLIGQHGLTEVVHYVSGDDEVMARHYRHARALIYPSQWEGFGLPVLEAMRYGCPVLCSDTSSLPEVAGEAAVYFDPKNVESIAACIELVVPDDSRCTTLAQRGTVQAARFTWDKCAEETLTVYRTLV